MEKQPIWIYSKKRRKGILDNDYYFFEDGTILHVYDKTQNKLNCEEEVDLSHFSDEDLEAIKSSAPNEVLDLFFK